MAAAKISRSLSFTISLEALKGVYGIDLPPIDRLKESLRRLMRTLIEYESSPGQWTILALLSNTEFDTTQSQLHYTYPIQCRSLFSNPFTLEKCLIQSHFNQKYSNYLYDILANTFYAGTLNLSIETADLRSQLQIPVNKLTNFGDFDRFALTPALQEINAYASFAVKFHTQRKGMKVTHVIFNMIVKKPISAIDHVNTIIPPKRPRLFIDDPALERAYAYLLNADTRTRRKYFRLACKQASKAKQTLDEEVFDRPDLWFQWIEKELKLTF